MLDENGTTVVEEPTAAVDPTPTSAEENVTSPEVKVETQVQEPVQETGDAAKMQAQIDNLNTALKQEREAGKTANQEFKDQLATSQGTIDKLKDVFSPEPQEEESADNGATMEQIEGLLDQREAARKEDEQRNAQAESLQKEVATMTSEWNGENGKPKYEDKEVLKWQEDNKKLHLSPSEAFNSMNRDSIVDWEIKNRMAKKPAVQEVEVPGGNPTVREPVAKSPNTTEDLRAAVMEAMDIASSDNIN